MGKHAEEVVRVITKAREQAPPPNLQAGASLQQPRRQASPLSRLLSSDAAVDASLAIPSSPKPVQASTPANLATDDAGSGVDLMETESIEPVLPAGPREAMSLMPEQPVVVPSDLCGPAMSHAISQSAVTAAAGEEGEARAGAGVHNTAFHVAAENKLPGRSRVRRAGASALGGMFGKANPRSTTANVITSPTKAPFPAVPTQLASNVSSDNNVVPKASPPSLVAGTLNAESAGGLSPAAAQVAQPAGLAAGASFTLVTGDDGTAVTLSIPAAAAASAAMALQPNSGAGALLQAVHAKVGPMQDAPVPDDTASTPMPVPSAAAATTASQPGVETGQQSLAGKGLAGDVSGSAQGGHRLASQHDNPVEHSHTRASYPLLDDAAPDAAPAAEVLAAGPAASQTQEASQHHEAALPKANGSSTATGAGFARRAKPVGKAKRAQRSAFGGFGAGSGPRQVQVPLPLALRMVVSLSSANPVTSIRSQGELMQELGLPTLCLLGEGFIQTGFCCP